MIVRLRVILSVFVITALVVLGSTFVTYQFGNQVLRAHEREQIRRQVIVDLDEITSTVKDAETGQRGFIITGEERYLAPFNDAVSRLPGEIAAFRSMPRIDISEVDVDNITRLVEEKMAELRKTVELRRTGGLDAAADAVRSGQGQQLMEKLRAEVARVQSIKTAALERDRHASDRLTWIRTIVFIVGALLNLIVLAWAYRRIAESIKLRDQALAEAVRHDIELKRQKDLLSVTLSSIGDCVIVTDQAGHITFMNQVAEEVTGWKFHEAKGRPSTEIFNIVNEQTRQPVESPVEKVMKQGVIVGLANHTILIRKDGTEIPIDDSGAPIRDADGVMHGVVLVFRDFSEQKRASRELHAAKEAAETANKAKDQFLAMLSHELRTPLTPVLATLNLWEVSDNLPEPIRSDVQMLRRNIELEARIIDDLLDLTRLGRGMVSVSPEDTDVHELLELLIGLSQSELHEKDLDVSLRLNAPRHYVHTDAARLQQVLWNILLNAIKFTESGGSITICTSNKSDGEIDVSIADSGIGMTQETISKLFVPFEQGDPTHHRRYRGLGLGMTISNALIQLLKGKLTAESPGLGQGSTFTVSFPTIASTPVTSEQDGALPTVTGKANLLLVEDHLDSARALAGLLKKRGYKVESVPTVAKAMEAVARDNFDLLVCDLGLPDASGIDLITEIRKTKITPAIALTGFGMQQDIERARQAGFDSHLTKPVNLQKLEATIRRLLKM
ncbi:MAG TPA: CHASE3 domain-containing protein [Candidatus Udaeobacter sp.]|nr:CHASE3 domain-containing protein [Candidatus Udaeobacter sp.]